MQGSVELCCSHVHVCVRRRNTFLNRTCSSSRRIPVFFFLRSPSSYADTDTNTGGWARRRVDIPPRPLSPLAADSRARQLESTPHPLADGSKHHLGAVTVDPEPPLLPDAATLA